MIFFILKMSMCIPLVEPRAILNLTKVQANTAFYFEFLGATVLHNC